VETDFRALSRRQGTLPAPQRADDHDADAGRLLITGPDRAGIVAAVSGFLFDRGANITKSQQYSTDPFGGTFFLRMEFNLDALAGRFGDLAEGFGQLADRFSMHWKMAKAAAWGIGFHQSTTIVFT
jgi:formyltetrahydrofolate deformylase